MASIGWYGTIRLLEPVVPALSGVGLWTTVAGLALALLTLVAVRRR